MNYKFFALVLPVLLLAAGCVNESQKSENNQSSPQQSGETLTPTPSINNLEKNSAKTFTMADVSMGNTPQKCLIAVNGNVYDVTAFPEKHPGGTDKILSLCGTEATAAFQGQHGGQMKPGNVLAGFEVGVLLE